MCPLQNLQYYERLTRSGAISDGKLSLSEEVGGNITDYMPVEKARELIRYCDDVYLSYGAPEEVFRPGRQICGSALL